SILNLQVYLLIVYKSLTGLDSLVYTIRLAWLSYVILVYSPIILLFFRSTSLSNTVNRSTKPTSIPLRKSLPFRLEKTLTSTSLIIYGITSATTSYSLLIVQLEAKSLLRPQLALSVLAPTHIVPFDDS